jgi:hypothetical protein
MTIPKYSDLLTFELPMYEECYLQKDGSSWDASCTIWRETKKVQMKLSTKRNKTAKQKDVKII